MAVVYNSADSYNNLSYTYEGAIPRTATGAGVGSSTASAYSFDPPNQYDESTITYDSSIRNYEGAIGASASGQGTSSSSCSFNVIPNLRNYDEPTILYDASNRSYEGDVAAQGTGTGLSFSSTVYVRTTFSSGIAAGEGGEVAVGLRIVPKTATGAGGATAGDTAIGLRTVLRVSTSSGVGTSSSYGATSHLRTASGAGTGGHEIVSFATLFRSADPSAGSGSLDVALWKNAGEYMDRIIRMRPVQGPGFRRKVNYSVKR